MPALGDLLKRLVNKEEFAQQECLAAFEEILTGLASPVQIAAFLVCLKFLGESTELLDMASQAALRHSLPFECNGDLVDIVGTGGDGFNTFNVSTAAAVIAAACGVRVAKARFSYRSLYYGEY